jgi:small conductance mechanosensitive channel
MEMFWNELPPAVRATVVRIATAGAIMLGFWIAASIIYRVIDRVEERISSKRDLLNLLAQTIWITLLIMGAMTALGTVGVNVTALVAGLGLSGFALGFALRDVLSNVLAGFLIIFYRPFDRGDLISVAGMEGRVIGIDLRYTSLDGGDKRVLVPNSNLFTNPIIVKESPKPPLE